MAVSTAVSKKISTKFQGYIVGKIVKRSPTGDQLIGWGASGRPKGSQSTTTVQLRDKVLEAFDELGGIDYLVALGKHSPKTFATLLIKVLPNETRTQISTSGEVDIPTVINIIDAEFRSMKDEER